MQEAKRIGWCLSSKTFVDPGQVTKLPVDDVKGKDHPYRKEDGVEMKTYTVYRVDYRTNKQELIGKVMERRREERSNNAAGMLQLAKKIYATSSFDSNIFVINEGSPGGPLFRGA